MEPKEESTTFDGRAFVDTCLAERKKVLIGLTSQDQVNSGFALRIRFSPTFRQVLLNAWRYRNKAKPARPRKARAMAKYLAHR